MTIGELSFDQSIATLRDVIAERVTVSVWGRDVDDSSPLVSMSGRADLGVESTDLPDEMRGAVQARVLHIGESSLNHVSLWPNRFIRGRVLEHPVGIEFSTLDGVVRIQRAGEPWVD
jgi:hypothetical protein